jgi:hypothetical protein
MIIRKKMNGNISGSPTISMGKLGETAELFKTIANVSDEMKEPRGKKSVVSAELKKLQALSNL